MAKNSINKIGLEIFERFMKYSEGINLETVKYLGAEKDDDCWDDYHDAWILWTCPEKEEFLESGGDYIDFLDEHGLNYIEEIDTDNYTIQFCL